MQSYVKNPPLNKCNDKLIGLWSYANSGNNPEDLEGTARTRPARRPATGWAMSLDAPTIDVPSTISGVAPHANIIAYDACTPSGCNNNDLSPRSSRRRPTGWMR